MLERTIDRLNVLESKNTQIKSDTKLLQNRLTALKKGLPGRALKNTDREQLLISIDEAKGAMAGSSLTMGDITIGLTEATLPLEMNFPYSGYDDLLKKIDFLEQQSFPFFRFHSFFYSLEQSGTGGCAIKGELVTPVSGGKIP